MNCSGTNRLTANESQTPSLMWLKVKRAVHHMLPVWDLLYEQQKAMQQVLIAAWWGT